MFFCLRAFQANVLLGEACHAKARSMHLSASLAFAHSLSDDEIERGIRELCAFADKE